MLARGGNGGSGNASLATLDCKRPLGEEGFTKGKTGEERVVQLELKTIADMGMASILSVEVIM